MENDEKHIVNLLKRGSSDGFRKTAVIYGPPIFALALEITGCREEAEEITSDTLMKVFRSIQSYREEKGSFKSWILSITRNSAISAIRRKKLEFLMENIPEIPTETEEESEEDLELLKQAIAKCPVKEGKFPYLKPTAILTDRGTFSAAEDFCSIFKSMKQGKGFPKLWL